MLEGSFYKISFTGQQSGVMTALLVVDSTHAILKGHFPGQPVLPGACMLQMVKDVLAEGLGASLRLKKADHIKFLAIVSPLQNMVLELKLTWQNTEDRSIIVVADLTDQGKACLKFKGAFVVS